MRVPRSALRPFMGALAVAVLVAVSASPAVAQNRQNVTIRLAADHTPPPHPAALAQAHFQRRLPEVLPGSDAGALDTIPQAVVRRDLEGRRRSTEQARAQEKTGCAGFSESSIHR